MFLTFEPSASITWMSEVPSRLLAKTICLPSGDQLGCESLFLRGVALLVRFTGFEPSASILKISKSPVRLELNTICVPSGDQSPTKVAPLLGPSLVSGPTRLLPSASILKIWTGELLGSSRAHAIFVPSAEKRGL